jgi:hypothetical protein
MKKIPHSPALMISAAHTSESYSRTCGEMAVQAWLKPFGRLVANQITRAGRRNPGCFLN